MVDQKSGAKPPAIGADQSPGNAIRAPKTAEIIANNVRKRIVRGELSEGDYLPPEGQLIASLNISRPTLREAFRILEAERLISVVPGSRTGARVHQPKVEAVARQAGILLQAQGTTVADVYEARLAIEPFIARRLAERRDLHAAEKLGAETERLTRLVNNALYADFMIGLVEFHRLLIELGGCRTLLFVTSMLQDVTAKYQVEWLQRRALAQEEQKRRSLWGIKSFWKLIELIKEGDGDAAEEHWQLHVANSNKAWVGPEDEHRLINVID